MKKKLTLLLAIVLIVSSSILPTDTVAQAAPKKIKFNVKKLNLTVGSNFQLRVYNLKKKQKVTFSSSNPEVVSLQETTTTQKKVTVNALSTGSSIISATAKRGKKIIKVLKCRIKVSPSAVGIKFMRQRCQLAVNEKLRLETIVKPNTSLEQPVFECDNPDIAKVNSRGIVTAVSPGTVTITATLLSCDISASCTVVILPEGVQKEEHPTHSKHVIRTWQDESQSDL